MPKVIYLCRYSLCLSKCSNSSSLPAPSNSRDNQSIFLAFFHCTLIVWSSETTISQINLIVHDANDVYNNFFYLHQKGCTPQVTAYFYCGGDHGFLNKEPCNKVALCRTRLSIRRWRIIDQVIVTMVESILVMANIITAMVAMM